MHPVDIKSEPQNDQTPFLDQGVYVEYLQNQKEQVSIELESVRENNRAKVLNVQKLKAKKSELNKSKKELEKSISYSKEIINYAMYALMAGFFLYPFIDFLLKYSFNEYHSNIDNERSKLNEQLAPLELENNPLLLNITEFAKRLDFALVQANFFLKLAMDLWGTYNSLEDVLYSRRFRMDCVCDGISSHDGSYCRDMGSSYNPQTDSCEIPTWKDPRAICMGCEYVYARVEACGPELAMFSGISCAIGNYSFQGKGYAEQWQELNLILSPMVNRSSELTHEINDKQSRVAWLNKIDSVGFYILTECLIKYSWHLIFGVVLPFLILLTNKLSNFFINSIDYMSAKAGLAANAALQTATEVASEYAIPLTNPNSRSSTLQIYKSAFQNVDQVLERVNKEDCRAAFINGRKLNQDPSIEKTPIQKFFQKSPPELVQRIFAYAGFSSQVDGLSRATRNRSGALSL